jgi:cyclic beta-1,2-glucan synthetase
LNLFRRGIRERLDRFQARIGMDGLFRDFGDDLPLRSELFSAAQLEQHAESLANWHQISPRSGPDQLLARLADNERILLEAHQLVTQAVERKDRIAPAAEWLLDNFYLIEEQIRMTRRHLPVRYSRGLPRLLNGPSAGYPLVYDLALELISHVDGRIDVARLRDFVAAYQKRRPLKLGELWAIPIMMRQALIENLRRVAARIVTATIGRTGAREWSDQLIECAEQTPHRLILLVAELAKLNPPLSPAFVAEVTRRLQGHSATFSVPLTWIEHRLAEQGQSIEQLVKADGQNQAVNQVSISNSISALRELNAIDWREFVESLSVVEQTLREDPSGVYSRMDFSSRNRYRQIVEETAKNSPLSEPDVARHAITLAKTAATLHGISHRTAHVGFFLIDQGQAEFERVTLRRQPITRRFARQCRAAALPTYVGSILLLSLLVTWGVMSVTGMSGMCRWAATGLLFLCATQLSVSLINWLSTFLVSPQRLPRLDFSTGIPSDCATLVVVPTMLTGAHGIERLLEDLEVRYLANRDEQLRFALLTDFCDAKSAELPDDSLLSQLAQAGVEALNTKYVIGDEDVFYLLHRPRVWNDKQQVWMGPERKRGKLSDLNAFLRGGNQSAFSLIVGRNPESLSRMKYVITLDTDTLLPRDSAQQLVGTMAHVLNRVRVDETQHRVVEGYGILQPGVATYLEQHGQSAFARLHAGDAGVDPYTRAISDVYQDLFSEGSFIGKGIYDIDAFIATTENRFPDNQILSHDLLEGSYVRSGLVSDIHVYESYPSRYMADLSRRHRWIRGDWQIAAWTCNFVPAASGKSQRNPISLLSRYKIFDNLRRSSLPTALLLVLLLAWLIWPAVGIWTAVVTCVVLVPTVTVSLITSMRVSQDVELQQHLWHSLEMWGKNLTRVVLDLAFLPFEAFVSLDAIIRTSVRMLITRRNMLEWMTASDSDRNGQRTLWGCYRTMAVAPALACVVALLLIWTRPVVLWEAGPLLGLWIASPWIAWRISQPAREREPALTPAQELYLHRVARKTWSFFEKFVGPEDHWLPPDNYQEHPVGVLAHRTSPTNIGVSLLSTLAAYDFGYISVDRLLERTARTLHSLGQLERYRGHFLNWYDTLTLQPLYPKYVSSVDSGNLAGHLLTLRAGLRELPDAPLLSPGLWSSLGRSRRALVQLAESATSRASALACLSPLLTFLERGPCASRCLVATSELLSRVSSLASDLRKLPPQALPESTNPWLVDLEQECRDHLADLLFLAPWLSRGPTPSGVWTQGSPEQAELRGELQGLLRQLDDCQTLRSLRTTSERAVQVLDLALEQITNSAVTGRTERDWFTELREKVSTGEQRALERLATIEQLARVTGEFAEADYEFLYDPARRLLAIGFDVSERRRDASFYDLLASESRLCSYVAIAQGQLKQEHWFALGRLLTTSNGQQMLLSWSGSMFEYLMPLLVMPTHWHTLLDQTCRAVVLRQRQYGKQRGVPWGISESGYNSTDARQNYQYRAFGVPGMGVKRGLADDLVIAPYATVMALMVSPQPACENLQAMEKIGFSGKYGFFEAIDYTRTRVAREHSFAIVRSHMAHHQGMSLLALAHCLLKQPMQRRFLADPELQATELLLQERMPLVGSFFPHASEASVDRDPNSELKGQLRVCTTPHTSIPEVHLLSNGRYHVMVTNSGGGYSQWNGLAVTRWREDATCDNTGSFCYLRDVTTGEVWSTAYHPTLTPSKHYQAIFSQSRAEFRRRDHDIKLHTEIAVSPEDDIEIRRVTLTNRSRVTRVIELTSYAEVVLAARAADATHPAFSNLFVQTELVTARQAILCSRRPRSHKEKPPWMLHLVAVRATTSEEPSYETDRLKFLGRRRSTQNPEVMQRSGRLSNTAGAVLDPIVAIRQRLILAPDATVSVDFVTGMAATRDEALVLVDRYRDHHLADRALDMAWSHGQVVSRQINATDADALLYGRLASSVLYMNPAQRAPVGVLARNQRGQSGLWGHGISGDLPIVLLKIGRAERLELARQLVQAHAYWRLKGLAVDLVVWNDGDAGYRQELQDLIVGLCNTAADSSTLDRPGGIFIRRADQLSDEDRVLLQTVARVIIVDSAGTLDEQLDRRIRSDLKIPELIPTVLARPELNPAQKDGAFGRELLFYNGLGGFTPDGREYVIRLLPGQACPAPWVNVLANPSFGTVISETGSAYTWSENAHEFRITPWANDPIVDPSGEAFYLRDEESGQVWSPMPQPVRSTTPYICRHGFGYSVYEHTESGITTELWVYVGIEQPVKFVRLKIRNHSGRTRHLSATGYVEWVMGEMRSRGLMSVVTEVDSQCGALLARNPFSLEFSQRVAFFNLSEAERTATGDRTEFLGRNGSTAKPAAMTRQRLSNKVGAGFDPCGALQTDFELVDGRQKEILFTLGVGRDVGHVRQIVQLIQQPQASQRMLDEVWEFWKRTLGAVSVQTPDPALNLLANGWLLYQTLACRYWARSGYYQSGGAFGFRDQLQDVSALLHTRPDMIRSHMLLCAAHQFAEGDVQHWWHPPVGRGVRTHFSDDFLWLPYVACRYVEGTGDTGVLDEVVPYLEGRPVKPEEESYYDLPLKSGESGMLYDHCVRAINRGLTHGPHGLPLIGGGDWNDGMNLVGEQGQGESVWLAFFLYEILQRFSVLARSKGDVAFAEKCDTEAAELKLNIEQHAWDGEWYRRAYFDNGDPLGAAINSECQIDSLPQSWAVLSGAGDARRSRQAMQSVDERLVRRTEGLIQLFDPPFDKSPLDPGYIKGYLPGVRENGGQYTHAAIWTVMAFAKLGDADKAWELFSLINPIHHSSTPSQIAKYKVEPYVAAADVYAVPPHTGRGGWTWYTGSASWMYRLITESLLGLHLQVDTLRVTPCMPDSWNSFQIHYRYRETVYHITVLAVDSASQPFRVLLDGVELSTREIPLQDDRRDHRVEISLCRN